MIRMRPPKHRQSRLLQPLNEILATEANVRLVRVLTLSRTSLTSGEVAKRAQLGRTSIYPALRVLERAGVVEFVGAGSHRQVQLRDRHPLAGALKALFGAEGRRFDDLIGALRELLRDLPLRPISAWVDQKPHRDLGDDTLTLYFVARPEEVEELVDSLDSHLAKVESEYDIHVAVHGLTRSELEALPGAQVSMLDETILLAGVPPTALLAPTRSAAAKTPRASHDEHDARSRRLALAIATKIKKDPGLIGIAHDRVKHRARKASPGERRELAEWMRLLSTMSPARLRRFLLEDNERAVRLRQSLPALNLLSPAERDAALRSQTDSDVIAAVTRR